MRIFLTGATGFVGSHVARRLVLAGHEVHALVRPGSDRRRIADLAGGLTLVPGELASPDLAPRVAAARPEAALHLAWYAEPGRYLDAPENHSHLVLAQRLFHALLRAGCRRLVGVGTCLEYDLADSPVAEQAPTAPRCRYAAAKLALSRWLEDLASAEGVSTAWARLFYLYGPFEDERRLVPSLINSLLSGGTARVARGGYVRDFMHAEDVAGALEAIALSPIEGPVNVGSGRPIELRELALALGRRAGGEQRVEFDALPAAPGEPPFLCADNRRLTEEVGYRPRIGLEEGLSRTVAWWSDQLRAG